MKRILLILLIFAVCFTVSAQKKGNKLMNWYNKDLKTDKIFGLSTEKSYKELLKDKKTTPIIVAIIDGGTDINHEDLKDIIWTNPDEIAGNGIDDDHNGYIDDMHGWNFIGNAKGENVHYDNLEVTRLYRELNAKYKDGGVPSASNDPDYILYQKVKEEYEKKVKETEGQSNIIQSAHDVKIADSIVKAYLGKESYTTKDLDKLKSAPENVKASVSKIKAWAIFGVSADDLIGYGHQLEAESEYQYNLDYDPRSIVGDNYKDNSNRIYGNNDVIGADPGHGTFVAGEVGAVRNNKIGVDGIAGNVQLMIVRVVPDGDERDKDVANGIRYAIENGAKVINMSFGKSYSPQKQFVDEAVQLAEKYDVLLVHAAGNDGENNDVVTNYPENADANGNKITANWLTVGASSMSTGKDLPASFSNYGKTKVDVFAPGVDLWGLEPGNKYGSASGTSMASPAVAGVAAVIRTYYPSLTAAQVREIIIKSATPYTEMVNTPGGAAGKSESVSFSELSVAGGVANLYQALIMAAEMAKGK
jgi:cell wall-associated protease